MTDTAHLGLPLLAAAQSQKHVTVNEALAALDGLVQLAVLDRDLSSPPAAPADGDRYLVAAGASGAWAGHETHVAVWLDGAWRFHIPKTGWRAYVADESALLVFDGVAWGALPASGSASFPALAIGTAVDAGNPLTARLNDALFVARPAGEGGTGDLRYKLSKESAVNTLSFLFQDAFSGRAEFGLSGSDDFSIKVSPDGSAWIEALAIDRASGRVAFPASGASPPFAHGRCRLATSGANLALVPCDGNGLVVGGMTRALPGAGVGLAPSGLAADTTYFVYAAWTGSAVALEASTTGHVTDAASGIEVKSGDATRTLVGMVRPVAGPAFADTGTQRLVLSWFNRRALALDAALASAAAISSATPTEIASSLRLAFLTWGEEPVVLAAAGSCSASAGAVCATALALDGTALAQTVTPVAAAGVEHGFALTLPAAAVAAGYRAVSLLGSVTTGTATWSAADAGASARTRLTAAVRG